MLNAYWEPLTFELPPVPADRQQRWRRCIDTALDSPDDICPWETAPAVTAGDICGAAAVRGPSRAGARRIGGKRSRSGMVSMTIHALAGKPPPKDLLIDADNLRREYYTRKPDFTDRAQRVSFGTAVIGALPCMARSMSRTS